jgi:hypothetical protein
MVPSPARPTGDDLVAPTRAENKVIKSNPWFPAMGSSKFKATGRSQGTI